MAAIEIENLEKGYGSHQVLEDVNMEIKEGEIFGLLGPNGVGKTTLFQTMMGLLRPDSGRIWIEGDRQDGSKKVKGKIGYLPSDISFYGNRTASQNLRYFADLADKNPDIKRLLETVGLTTDADRKVNEFSSGMKKRLGIAQSLIKDPEIMVYDEPTTGLDPEGKRNFRRHVQKINRERDLTILISSHVTTEISPLCGRFGVLYDGMMAATGTKKELNQETGARKKISLRVENRKEALSVLQNFECKFDEKDREITVYSEDIDRDELLEHLVSSGVSVRSLKLEEETLENAYMEIIGG